MHWWRRSEASWRRSSVQFSTWRLGAAVAEMPCDVGFRERPHGRFAMTARNDALCVS